MKNMKHLFFLLALFSALLTNAQKEEILFYHSDIKVDTTTTITVTETIKLYANGDRIRRGIYRSLPGSRNINGRKVRAKYKVISVKKNGAEEKYHTKSGSGNYSIYIGDEDVYLSPGEYSYEIKYIAGNQIGFFDNYDELYWNVNGNHWDFDIREISATVNLPAGATVIQQSCYTGAYGTDRQNCTGEKSSESSVTWKAENLYSKEGLTIAVGFTKGFIAPPPPPGPFERYGLMALLSVTFTGLCIYFYRSWRKHGVDPPRPTVYPQFNVPEMLSPASVGMLNDEFYTKKLLTASLVNLAVKGFVHIKQNESKTLGLFKKTSFVLQKMKEPDEALRNGERALLTDLFKHSNQISLEGEYDEKLATAVDAFESSVKKKHKELINEGNNTKFLLFPVMLILIAFIAAQCFIIFTTQSYTPALVMMISFIVGGFIMFFLITYLLERFKWFGWAFVFLGIVLLIILITIAQFDEQKVFNLNHYVSAGFFILSYIALCLYGYYVKRPSEEKLRIQSLIDGFKMYLGAAEERQLQHFNPPQMTPKVFENLLPYAMVLGVDKIWGEKFQSALKSATMESGAYTSTWYSGQSFSPVIMGSSLNAELTNSLTSSSIQPSSSDSGSGGGGFSGGGGGGGGGGGW